MEKKILFDNFLEPKIMLNVCTLIFYTLKLFTFAGV